jgi:hypothetical protein
MSNNNTVVKQLYACDGSGTTFAIPFFFLSGEESVIKVYLIDNATEIATLLTIVTDYTLNSPATEVTTVTAYPSSKSILIKRVSPKTQLSEFIQGPFPFEAVEEQFDRVISLIQEVSDAQESQISLPIGSSLTNVTLPVPEANKLIGWNGTADGLENKDELDVANLQTQIDALDTRLDTAETDIDTLQTTVGSQGTRLSAAEVNIINTQADVSTLQSDYTTLGATVANQGNAIDDLQDQIDLINDRGADVDQLLIDVAAHETRLDNIDPIITDYGTRINQLEAASPISFFSGSQIIGNNETTPVDINNMIRDADGTQLAEITVQVERRTDSEKRYARINLLLQYVQEDALWYVARVNTVVVAGEPDGITFSVVTDGGDKTGQVQYISDNMSGANYSGTLKFVGKEIPTGV